MQNPQFGMQGNYPQAFGGQPNIPGQPYFPAGSQMIRLQFDPKVRKFNKEFLNPTVLGLDNVNHVNEMISQIENLALLDEEANLKQEHRDLMNKKPLAYVLSLCIVGCCWLYTIGVRQTNIRHRRNEIRHLFRTETQNICQKYNSMYFSAQGIFATYRTEILLVPSQDAIVQPQYHHHHHHHHHLQEQLVVQDPQTNNVMLEDMIEEGILELIIPFGFQPIQQNLIQQSQQQQLIQEKNQQNIQNINSNPDSPIYQQQQQQQQQQLNQDINQQQQQQKQDFNYPAEQYPPKLQFFQNQEENYIVKENYQVHDNLNLDYPKKQLSDEEHQQLQLKSQFNI